MIQNIVPDWSFQVKAPKLYMDIRVSSRPRSRSRTNSDVFRRTKLPLTPPFSILSLLLHAGLEKTSSKAPTLTSLSSPAYNSTFFNIYSFRIHSTSLKPIKQASKQPPKWSKPVSSPLASPHLHRRLWFVLQQHEHIS